MVRTGYSDGDLRNRFYEHLLVEIKDLLPTMERTTKTLDELIVVATDFDTRMRQCKAEKAWEQGHSTGTTSYDDFDISILCPRQRSQRHGHRCVQRQWEDPTGVPEGDDW